MMFVVLAFVAAQMPLRTNEPVPDQPLSAVGNKAREGVNEKQVKAGNQNHGSLSHLDRKPKANPKKGDQQQEKEKIVHRPKVPETKY